MKKSTFVFLATVLTTATFAASSLASTTNENTTFDKNSLGNNAKHQQLVSRLMSNNKLFMTL